MSRSYRVPWCVDGYGSKRKSWLKRYANKRVRHTEDVPDGKAYRRVYDPWNICDWKFYEDSRPWWSNWKQEWVEGTPEWKARRK